MRAVTSSPGVGLGAARTFLEPHLGPVERPGSQHLERRWGVRRRLTTLPPRRSPKPRGLWSFPYRCFRVSPVPRVVIGNPLSPARAKAALARLRIRKDVVKSRRSLERGPARIRWRRHRERRGEGYGDRLSLDAAPVEATRHWVARSPRCAGGCQYRERIRRQKREQCVSLGFLYSFFTRNLPFRASQQHWSSEMGLQARRRGDQVAQPGGLGAANARSGLGR